MGNPTVYRNKKAEWSHVNRMDSFNGINYKYNYAGIRTGKTANNVTTKYYYDGENLLVESNGTRKVTYIYGADGISGFKIDNADNIDNAVYYYLKNQLGDVYAITNASGNILSRYVYDAFGNHKVLNPDGTENTSATFIGNVNPIRYRGYYFDVETGLYYLQSRYYDPETGRFITADSVEYLDLESINGLNLYSYCGNNPVMYVDPSGHLAFFIVTAIIGAVVGFGITTAVDYFDDGAVFNGSVHWGWYLGTTLLGAAIGAGIGMGISYCATNTLTASFTDIRFGFALKAAQNGNYGKLARFATHNKHSKTVGLGKYIENSPNSYEKLSKKYGYTYYELKPKYWNKTVEVLKQKAWNVNVAFLDQQLALNKTFVLLSNNYSGSYLYEIFHLLGL